MVVMLEDRMVERGQFVLLRNFIAARAERKFKEIVGGIVKQLPTDYLEYLAKKNIPVSVVMREAGWNPSPNPALLQNPGVQHLLGLGSGQFLELIADVSAAHAEILRHYPKYVDILTDDLKRLLVDG